MEGHKRSIAIFTILLVLGFQTGNAEKIPLCIKEESNIRTNTSERLANLRNLMKQSVYNAIIIPTDDEHQSEYVSDYDKRREYITGFTGTAGTAVVLLEPKEARMWTDSRYYIQAEEEMDCNWTLMKYEGQSITDWLKQTLSKDSIVVSDPKLISQQKWDQWRRELEKGKLVLKPDEANLIDQIWGPEQNRSRKPDGPVFIQELKFSGKPWEDKITEIRKKLTDKNIEALVVTSLTEVAWLLNLRGSDVPYSPVFKSFVILTKDSVTLYVDTKKLNETVLEHLNSQNCPASNPSSIKVKVKEYTEVYKDAQTILQGLKVLMPTSVSYALYSKASASENIIIGTTPTLDGMLIKNPIEREGMNRAMIKDSVALITLFAKLEADIAKGIPWNEIKAADEIQNLRKKQEYYMGESFEAISAVGKHAAMPHYVPKTKSNLEIDKDHMFLMDTGAQYLDGTTDITRTVHFGKPTDFQKETYTRVLIGAISLASLVFPEGTTDIQVDVLTRKALYRKGLDYGHGTGHGVGSFLSVHEFPPSIRMPERRAEGYAFQPGIYFSIEPGFYQENEFGIRHETIFTVEEADTQYHFENKTFYQFLPVVLVPFENKMIDLNLLKKEQVKWLDDYHVMCLEKIGPLLRSTGEMEAFDWLQARTRHSSRWNSSPKLQVDLASAVLYFCLVFRMII